MNQTREKLVPVICPKCGKESMMVINIVITKTLDGNVKVKGLATPKIACFCEELKKAMDEAYENTEV